MQLTSGTSWVEGKTPVPFDMVRISDITDPSKRLSHLHFNFGLTLHKIQQEQG